MYCINIMLYIKSYIVIFNPLRFYLIKLFMWLEWLFISILTVLTKKLCSWLIYKVHISYHKSHTGFVHTVYFGYYELHPWFIHKVYFSHHESNSWFIHKMYFTYHESDSQFIHKINTHVLLYTIAANSYALWYRKKIMANSIFFIAIIWRLNKVKFSTECL